MLIVDSHQDIAWNRLTFGRDITRSARETRRIEAGRNGAAHIGDALTGWPDYQQARIALVFATLFVTPAHRVEHEWDNQYYINSDQAHYLYRAQMDYYQYLFENYPDYFRFIKTRSDLADVLKPWFIYDRNNPLTYAGETLDLPRDYDNLPDLPVGIVLLMEGAEGVRAPSELGEWWYLGVRLIGPAWACTRFCGGTNEPGPLTKEGYALLDGMGERGFILDVSHMDKLAVLQSLDRFPGKIVATHANALSLLKDSNSNRHLSDRVIRGLIERDGVIGVVPKNDFLKEGWKRGYKRDLVSISDCVDHIDHICQLAGSAHHVAIGSDFDGGFGLQSVPPEIDTIADLQIVGNLLHTRGYYEDEISAIMGMNWISVLEECLPKD